MKELEALAGAISGLAALAWTLGLAAVGIPSLGALCGVMTAFFPDRVRSSGRMSLEKTLRVTLLGAINVVGGVVLAGALARAGGLFALLGLLILGLLACLASMGLAGLAWTLSGACFPERAAGPLPVALGGGLLASAFFFPILGQVFALLCLFCAVGSAAQAPRSPALQSPGG